MSRQRRFVCLTLGGETKLVRCTICTDLIRGELELVLHVDGGGSQEDVHTRQLGQLHCFPCSFHIPKEQQGDTRSVHADVLVSQGAGLNQQGGDQERCVHACIGLLQMSVRIRVPAALMQRRTRFLEDSARQVHQSSLKLSVKRGSTPQRRQHKTLQS